MNAKGRTLAERSRTAAWRRSICNLPYILMAAIGASALYFSFPEGAWQWLAPTLYLAYSVAGAFWLILFVCPYCACYGSASCPSGHGMLAAKLRPRKSGGSFPKQFRKHIPVIVPLWLIPLVIGAVHLIGAFSWGLTALLVAFGADAFALLPMVSTRKGCAYCPQKANCPWMGGKCLP